MTYSIKYQVQAYLITHSVFWCWFQVLLLRHQAVRQPMVLPPRFENHLALWDRIFEKRVGSVVQIMALLSINCCQNLTYWMYVSHKYICKLWPTQKHEKMPLLLHCLAWAYRFYYPIRLFYISSNAMDGLHPENLNPGLFFFLVLPGRRLSFPHFQFSSSLRFACFLSRYNSKSWKE